MRYLITSRNIINTEEVETWLRDTFVERYSPIQMWITSVVRKWIIKKAPAAAAPIQDQTGLPDWLRTAMQRGDVPESVVLDAALEQRITPVLDYMLDLVTQKPDANIAAIGFEVAEQRSVKWHQEMQRRAPPTPVEEDGAQIIKTYTDGYTWRRVVGRAAMDREGNAMGHCVGRLSYYQMVIRAKTEIVSLRDQQNEPHVTIEIGRGGTTIHQIKGKANKDVLPKYLPYVEDFLKSRPWDKINFDGAESLRQKITNWVLFNAEPWFEFGGVRAVVNLTGSAYSAETRYVILQEKEVIGSFVIFQGTVDTIPRLVLNTYEHNQAAAAFVRRLCVAKMAVIDTDNQFTPQLLDGCSWKRRDGWTSAGDEDSQMAMTAIFGVPPQSVANSSVCLDGRVPVARWIADTNELTLLYKNVSQKDAQQAVCLALNKEATVNQVSMSFTEKTKPLQDMTSWLAKQLAGKQVDTKDDASLVNSLMAALKQPDAAGIKAGYIKLKGKSEIRDSDFKALGFSTGGRAINAIGIVLLCTLPLKNMAPFRQYVFNKPNTMTCWTEMLTHPDHLLSALASYGLSAETVKQIVGLLRNEFLRLVPTAAEIEELDLDGGAKMRLQQALKYAAAHKQNAARSKALWGSL